MSPLELSLNVAVAVNCSVAPVAMEGFDGVTAMDTKVALVTVNDAVLVRPPNAAVMVTVPRATPVAWPAVACSSLMVANEGFEDVQFAKPVRSCIFPSLKLPNTRKNARKPSGTVELAGVTCSPVRVPPSTSS